MRNDKFVIVNAIRDATYAKLREQGEVISRVDEKGLDKLPSAAFSQGDADPTFVLNGDINFNARSINDERKNALDLIADIDIRNAVFSHLLVADHLEMLRAIEEFIKATGSYVLQPDH